MARKALGELSLSYPAARRSRLTSGVGRFTLRGWAGELGLKHDDTAARSIALALLFVLLVGATFLLLFYLWQGWQIAALHALIAEQREKIDKLQAENEALRLQVEEAFSLKRIEVYAKTVLGMIEPPLRYLRLPVDVPPMPLPDGKSGKR